MGLFAQCKMAVSAVAHNFPLIQKQKSPQLEFDSWGLIFFTQKAEKQLLWCYSIVNASGNKIPEKRNASND